MCKWPDDQKEQRHIDLYYHLSEVFDVRRFIQIETSREGGNLTWEKLVEEAKRQEHVGKEYAKFRRENGGSGTPSYQDKVPPPPQTFRSEIFLIDINLSKSV